MSESKKYWNSIDQLENDPDFLKEVENEFPTEVPVDEFLNDPDIAKTNTSRRDFLKFLGFSVTAASLAACEAPVVKSIPYVIKPEEVNPGIANYYATAFYDGHDFSGILVKTREGRPIHIQGNDNCCLCGGSVNARINSSVLSLYDSKRYSSPEMEGQKTSWEDIDNTLKSKIIGNVRLLTSSIISPSTNALISEMSEKLNGGEESKSSFQHVTYDTVSHSGLLKANGSCFGKAVAPSYYFDKAQVVVSVGADFMGNWLFSNQYHRDFATTRKPGGKWMSRHFQFEASMTLTGSNADVRGAVKPSEYGNVIAMLYNEVSSKVGGPTVKTSEISDDNGSLSKIKKAASELVAAKGKSLVVSSSNDPNAQILVNGINDMLGNYGETIDLDRPLMTKQSTGEAFDNLISEMNDGKVDVILVRDVDPCYSTPKTAGFHDAFQKVKTRVSFASVPNETSGECNYVCPDSHYLESWGDAMPVSGCAYLQQPVIRPLFSTRQFQDSLLTWHGSNDDFYSYIQKYWEKNMFSGDDNSTSFGAFWNKTLHDGCACVSIKNIDVIEVTDAANSASGFNADVQQAANNLEKEGGQWEVEFLSSIALGDGSQSSNPWLQELPDPITKIVWDNYLTMNPGDASANGYNLKLGQQLPASMAQLTVNGISVELPVVATPGQKKGTVGVFVGYGKSKVGEELVGKNVYPMCGYNKGEVHFHGVGNVENLNSEYEVATAQSHGTMMGRKIINETNLETFTDDGKKAFNPQITVTDVYGTKQKPQDINLWNDHAVESFGHRWGMSIDLSTCTGCSACVTACHSENNVPVVGKDEVRRKRTMFWLRIDRYFSSSADPDVHASLGAIKDYDAMEIPADYPDIAHQPVMCQHCNHAPCETVCPVAATTHSNEGLNQMAYNRCVGTRYCANNCPYKVRRFNWFQYDRYSKFTDVNPAQDDYGRMVLNPDIVVRSRGVMEKCSMCVQRIQEGKLDAKKIGKPVADGDIKTACASACPTNAITFGDLNDAKHTVNTNSKDDRAYSLLEEVGTQPNIYYMTKVRNRSKAEDSQNT